MTVCTIFPSLSSIILPLFLTLGSHFYSSPSSSFILLFFFLMSSLSFFTYSTPRHGHGTEEVPSVVPLTYGHSCQDVPERL